MTGLWHSACVSWYQKDVAVIAYRFIIRSLAVNAIKRLKTWNNRTFPSIFFLWAHLRWETSWCPRELVQTSIAPAMGSGRGPCAVPGAERAGQSRTKHTVLPQHPCSPAHIQALLPLGSSQMRVWWPRDPPRSRHTEHPLSPLLPSNTNGHLFTPNWANLIFISHLGHRTSKQIFLHQTDFLTLWFHSWFAVIFVWRAGLLSLKNGKKKSYIGSCTGL